MSFSEIADQYRTFGTPIYVSAVPSIITIFHVSLTIAILPASMYAFGVGIGALLCSAISEVLGRTLIYKITTPLCLLFTSVGGASQSVFSLLITRFLAGIFAGPWLTVGSGTLNDIFDISLERMGTYVAVFFILFIIWATQVGPMTSAAVISSSGNWRWTLWTHGVFVGLVMIGAFMLPETYAPEIKRRRDLKAGRKVLKRNLLGACWTSLRRPFHSKSCFRTKPLNYANQDVVVLMVEPVLFPSGLVLAITQSVVFSYYGIYNPPFKGRLTLTYLSRLRNFI